MKKSKLGEVLGVLGIGFLTVWFLNTTIRPDPNPKAAQKATVSVQPAQGQGSGFVIKRTNPAGQPRVFVWTAAHVVDAPEDHTVKIQQIIRFEAHKVGTTDFKARIIMRSDGEIDLALLWLDAPPEYFEGVVFDEIDPVEIGHPLYHVGNFLGTEFDGAFSTGVMSQVGVIRSKGWPWGTKSLDQTTTMIVPGSSGGPLFNAENGKVVGVTVGWAGMPGFSFFVPLRTLYPFAAQHGFKWAVYGADCPSDRVLDEAAKKYVPKAPPAIIEILFGPQPQPESKTKPQLFKRPKGW